MGIPSRQPPHFMCQSNKELPRYTAQRNRKYNKGSQSKKQPISKTESCSNLVFAPAYYLLRAHRTTQNRTNLPPRRFCPRVNGKHQGQRQRPGRGLRRDDGRATWRRGGSNGSREGAQPETGGRLPGSRDKRNGLRSRAPLSHRVRWPGPN